MPLMATSGMNMLCSLMLSFWLVVSGVVSGKSLSRAALIGGDLSLLISSSPFLGERAAKRFRLLRISSVLGGVPRAAFSALDDRKSSRRAAAWLILASISFLLVGDDLGESILFLEVVDLATRFLS